VSEFRLPEGIIPEKCDPQTVPDHCLRPC